MMDELNFYKNCHPYVSSGGNFCNSNCAVPQSAYVHTRTNISIDIVNEIGPEVVRMSNEIPPNPGTHAVYTRTSTNQHCLAA